MNKADRWHRISELFDRPLGPRFGVWTTPNNLPLRAGGAKPRPS